MDPCMRQIRNLIHQNEQWVPDSYITKGNRKNSQWNCSASYISNKKTAYLALIALNINFDNKRISHCNGYNILKSNQKQKLLTLHSQPSMSTLRTSRSAVVTDRASSNRTEYSGAPTQKINFFSQYILSYRVTNPNSFYSDPDST